MTEGNEPPKEKNLMKEVYDTVKASFSSSSSAAAALTEIVKNFLMVPFKVEPGSVIDIDQKRSTPFPVVIHADEPKEPSAFLIDKTVAVIDILEDRDTDLSGLRAAYKQIAEMKSLKKEPAKGAQIGVPMGVIFIRSSSLTLEAVADELDLLGNDTPSELWPDMVVLHDKGIITYAAQFPGEEASGDFFFSSERLSFIPPIYVVRVIRALADYTLNRLVAFLVARLAIFSPDVVKINYNDLIRDLPSHALSHKGYQYNLQGQLVPVPERFYNDRYLAPLPLRIETASGQLLGTVQFQEWQEGGIILVRGGFPLEPLFLFLKVAFPSIDLSKAGAIRRPGILISYALPITKVHFAQMLRVFQQRSSGIVVKEEPGRFVVQKVSDEGTSSPFIARLMVGMMKLRDLAFFKAQERERFDASYDLALSGLRSVRETVQQVQTLWEQHTRKISSGEIVSHSVRTVQISENIDRTLKKEVESFLNTSVRVLKQGMQNLVKELHGDIGFFFAKDAAFNAGLAALKAHDPVLADYLQKTRAWTEPLIKVRNDDLEHGTWSLPAVRYTPVGDDVQVQEPQILGQPITAFLYQTLQQLLSFVEEMTAHHLQKQMPKILSITEIPLAERPLEVPERFRATIAQGGLPIWIISFSSTPFEER